MTMIQSALTQGIKKSLTFQKKQRETDNGVTVKVASATSASSILKGSVHFVEGTAIDPLVKDLSGKCIVLGGDIGGAAGLGTKRNGSVEHSLSGTKRIKLNEGNTMGPLSNGGCGGTPVKSFGVKLSPTSGSPSPGKCVGNKSGPPKPSITLFPVENVRLEWSKPWEVGAGLANMGNTCFLNSVIQCLTYCPPLVNHLVVDKHQDNCKLANFCMMCELERHIKRAFQNGGRVIKPQFLVERLRTIGQHFRPGSQEDAHEFLRLVIEKMQTASLHMHAEILKRLDPYSKETTVVNRIFGGMLRSQVTCLRCRTRSNSYDHTMDLILDIRHVSTLEEALRRFVAAETLRGDNAYRCESCATMVEATKQMSIYEAPNVATIQLKRFEAHLHEKISKRIRYPLTLNLRPFMSTVKKNSLEGTPQPVNYRLCGVIVHQGYSIHGGHYLAYVQAPDGRWYVMNDECVRAVNVEVVLNQEAYVLFYLRSPLNGKISATHNGLSRPATPIKLTNGGGNGLSATTTTTSPSRTNGYSTLVNNNSNGLRSTFYGTGSNAVNINGVNNQVARGNENTVRNMPRLLDAAPYPAAAARGNDSTNASSSNGGANVSSSGVESGNTSADKSSSSLTVYKMAKPQFRTTLSEQQQQQHGENSGGNKRKSEELNDISNGFLAKKRKGGEESSGSSLATLKASLMAGPAVRSNNSVATSSVGLTKADVKRHDAATSGSVSSLPGGLIRSLVPYDSDDEGEGVNNNNNNDDVENKSGGPKEDKDSSQSPLKVASITQWQVTEVTNNTRAPSVASNSSCASTHSFTVTPMKAAKLGSPIPPTTTLHRTTAKNCSRATATLDGQSQNNSSDANNSFNAGSSPKKASNDNAPPVVKYRAKSDRPAIYAKRSLSNQDDPSENEVPETPNQLPRTENFSYSINTEPITARPRVPRVVSGWPAAVNSSENQTSTAEEKYGLDGPSQNHKETPDYDDLIDRGKRKKVKWTEERNANCNGNVFQRAFDEHLDYKRRQMDNGDFGYNNNTNNNRGAAPWHNNRFERRPNNGRGGGQGGDSSAAYHHRGNRDNNHYRHQNGFGRGRGGGGGHYRSSFGGDNNRRRRDDHSGGDSGNDDVNGFRRHSYGGAPPNNNNNSWRHHHHKQSVSR